MRLSFPARAATGGGSSARKLQAPRRWKVGSPGASQPPAPTDPGVTLSRHRALLTSVSGRADPPPLGEQIGLSFE
jgi:hypothetical protein